MSSGRPRMAFGLAALLVPGVALFPSTPALAGSLLPVPTDGAWASVAVAADGECRKARRHKARRGKGADVLPGKSRVHRGDGRGVRLVRSGRRSAVVVADPPYGVVKGGRHVQVPGPWSKGRHLRHRARQANTRPRLVVELPTRRNFKSAHRFKAKSMGSRHRGAVRGGGRGRR